MMDYMIHYMNYLKEHQHLLEGEILDIQLYTERNDKYWILEIRLKGSPGETTCDQSARLTTCDQSARLTTSAINLLDEEEPRLTKRVLFDHAEYRQFMKVRSRL